jgi:hypothetical protein
MFWFFGCPAPKNVQNITFSDLLTLSVPDKAIPETHRVHEIRQLHFHYDNTH